MAFEIEESEYNELNKARALLAELSTKPEAKRHFERALKTVVPTVETEDDRDAMAAELAKPHIEKVEALTSKIEGLFKVEQDRRDADAKAAQERNLDARFAELKAMGWQDDGIETIKKTMVERGIPDVEAAAALVRSREPAASVRTWESPRYVPAKGTDLKKLFADEDRWCDDEIGNVLNEMRAA